MSTTTGAYGIRRAEYGRTNTQTCLTCYRSWHEDITPAGRCPWEHRHDTDHAADTANRRHKAIVAGLWG